MADIIVNTTVDEADGSIIDGDISLRDAIAAAAAGDRILFDGSVFVADDDHLTNATIGLTLGELALTQDITINGDTNGDGVADVTIDGGGTHRLFNVDNINAGFESLTLENGYAGIRGGAIYSVGTFRLLNSTLLNNESDALGGAIQQAGGGGYIANSTFSGNAAGTVGGAIHSETGTFLTVVNSTFYGNYSSGPSLGGGAIFTRGTLYLDNSTITGNRSSANAGGVHVEGSGVLNIANSIVAGNSASSIIDDIGGAMTSNGANIFGSTVSGSTGGDVTLTGGPGLALTDVFASVSSKTVNGVAFDSGDLADNGGPTLTVDIQGGGLAEDAGEASSLPTEATLGIDVNRDGVISASAVDVDQRGGVRVDGTVDIGAVETVQTLVVNTAVDEADGDIFDGDISLRDAIAAATAGDTIRFDGAVFGADHDELTNTAIGLTLGTLVLSQGVTINGDTNGDGIADVTIDGSGNGDNRSFLIGVNTTGVALESLTITGANYSLAGAALYASPNSGFSVLNSTFDNNTTTYNAGAIAIRNGVTGVIANSTFTDNTSGSGVIDVGTATLTVVNSTFSANDSTGAGFVGAAIQSFNSTIDIINSTITGNHADGSGGGGVHQDTGGTVTIANTIIAGNSSASGNDDVTGTITSNGANIFGSAVTGSMGGDVTLTGGAGLALTDVFETVVSASVGGSPAFAQGELADNGGPTRTIDILNGGLAEGGGDAGGLPSENTLGIDVNRDGVMGLGAVDIDQRGADRQIGTLDIGAVEQFTTFVVNTTVDENDGIAVGGVSLRDAVAVAADGDRIIFDGSIFTANNDPLNNAAITLSVGEIVINDGITINGDTNGDGIADVTLDGTGTGARLLNVVNGTTGVALESLTLANTDNAFTGGALLVDDNAEVSILNSTFDNNTSTGYGAIRTAGSGANLTIANSTFTGNASNTGAIDASGTVTLLNSTLYGNRATDAGLGGGAIYITSGTTSLYNTTITGNYSAGDGGGIFNDNATLNVTNSIIAGNSAAGSDNDVHNDTAADAVSSSNAANLFGSVVSGAVVGDVFLTGAPGFTLGDAFATVASSNVGGSPVFDHGTLADNGGPTRTVDILQGGFADNSGKTADLPSEASLGLDVDRDGTVSFSDVDIDQRGADRAVGAVDIGALELVTSVVVTTTEEADGDLSADDISLREALSIVADGGTVTFDPTLFTADDDERVNTTLQLTQGPIDLGKDVTINGDTNSDGVADVTLDGSGLGGVQMFQAAFGNVNFVGLTFDGGQNSYAIRNGATGTVRVENSTFVNNYNGYGGAIANQGTTQVIGSTFADNTASGGGGAIYNGGTLDVLNSTFYGNLALGGASGGGAIYSIVPLTVTNATITGNFAAGEGGGIRGGPLALNNSIVAGNDSGSGDPEIQGAVTSNQSNIFGAGFSGVAVGNDLILGGGTDLDDIFDRTGTVALGGFSVTGGLLRSNGGPVDTVGLLADSNNPAIDVAGPFSEAALGIDFNGDGDLLDLVDKDGRGFDRTVDILTVGNDGMTFADIGALETQSIATPGPDYFIEDLGISTKIGGTSAGNDRYEFFDLDDTLVFTTSLPGDVDLANGGEGTDEVGFQNFASAVSVDLSNSGPTARTQDDDNAKDATGTFRDIADLVNFENVRGSDFSDFIRGDDESNRIFYTADEIGLGGYDDIGGGDGTDTADFSQQSGSESKFAVWVDLDYESLGNPTGTEAWTRDTTDTTSGTWRQIAELTDIENVKGTEFSDYFRGDANDNTYEYASAFLGGGGLDQVDGGSGGSDTIDFSDADSAIWVKLAVGGIEARTQDDDDATDVPSNPGDWRDVADLSNIDNVTGTRYSDLFVGDAGNNTYIYHAVLNNDGGLDEVDGGSDGSDTFAAADTPFAVWIDLSYSGATGIEAWTRDNATVTSGAWRSIAELVNIENLTGSAFDDALYGDAEANVFHALAGTDLMVGETGDDQFMHVNGFDTVDGGGDTDTSDFSGYATAIWVDLSYTGPTGFEAWTRGGPTVSTGAWQAIADLTDIENVTGSAFADAFYGDAGDNMFSGGSGDDRFFVEAGFDDIDGGGDTDTADFSQYQFAVWVDLSYTGPTGFEAWTRGGTDVNSGAWQAIANLSNIENLTGSAFDDALYGDAEANVFHALTGTDLMVGETGDDLFMHVGGFDTVDGGGDTDTSDFSGYATAIWVDLSYTGPTGFEAWTRGGPTVTTGAWQAIADLTDIENVTGSAFADAFYGDAGDNMFSGGSGDDRFFIEAGLDEVDGGGDTDTADFSQHQFAVWVDLDYESRGNATGFEAWTRGGTTVTSGTWQAIAELSAIENLVGSAFEDYLLGDGGSNALTGGNGNDAFAFKDGFGTDTVIDFQDTGSGFEDVLDFSEHGTVNSFANITEIDVVSGNTVVTTTDGTIILQGVTGGVTIDDFVF